MSLSDDRMEKALRFLAESDEDAAALFVDMERAEIKAKRIKDELFLHEEGSIPERQAKAAQRGEYLAAMDGYYAAAQKFKHIANKRATEELVVRAWQTLAANRRQGQI